MPNKYLDSVGLAEYTSLIKSELAPKASPAFTGTPTAPTPTAGDDSTKIATTEYVQEEIRTHANMPIGHEYFTMNPNIPQGSLPLFGGVYSRETYADLWAWVQQQTGYFITDSAWQAMANSQNGNVPFYSDGDGSTTFRVPSLKCWIKAANGTVSEVGSYLAAGLPNIDGFFTIQKMEDGGSAILNTNGAISNTVDGSKNWGIDWESKNNVSTQKILFNASNSNSIYGNSTTVQPPSIVGMWLVKAYGVVEETGTIDEQQYIDDRIAAEVTRADGKYLPFAGGTLMGNIAHNKENSNFVIEKLQTDMSLIMFGGNNSYTGGASLYLYGRDNATYSGRFYLTAHNGTTGSELQGRPDGTLTWKGKEVERVNSSGTEYIRYESGLQLCWGIANGVTTGGNTITFPVAFSSRPRVVTGIDASNPETVVYCTKAASVTTTNFKVVVTDGSYRAWGGCYIAVGSWK